MPYLTQELLKNCTSLIKLNHLGDLCSDLCGYNTEVYGLRAEFGYPEHLISKNNKSVKEIEGYKKNYQNLQLQCVEKYQRQMFMDQSCKVGNQDELMKRRNKLNQMGIKI